MKNKDFCHLHVHSHYSLLDGVGSPEKYMKRAKELGFEYLAITDHGSIDGFIKFQQAGDKYGVKPIFGVEGYVVPDATKKKKKEKRGHIVFLIKNEVGFNNICLLLNKANVDGFYHRPRMSYQWILDHCEGLIISTACVGGFLGLDGGEDFFWNLDEKIEDDLYLEVMPHHQEIQCDMNNFCLDIHEEYPDVQLIGTADCHYIDKEDAKAQDVLLAVNSKKTWNDPNRWKQDFRDLYLQSANEMISNFKNQDVLTEDQIMNAMRNTISIAKKCNFRIEQKQIKLPKVRKNGEDFLESLCLEQLDKKIKGDKKKYLERFRREFNLLKKKNFIDYFLIVHELIEWCNKNNVLTGAGRGCFSGDTKVSLLNGDNVSLEDLVELYPDPNETFWVYSCKPDGEIVAGKAKNPRVTKITEEVCLVKLDNEEEIKCTPDHLFLMRNGEYVEAKDLKAGNSLMPLYLDYNEKGYEIYFDNKENIFKLTHYLNFRYKKGFVIHHKDIDKYNNNPENLEQLSCSEHGALHAKLNSKLWKDPKFREAGIKRYWKTLGSEENRKATSERNKTKEHRKKVSKGQKRLWGTTEYREKMQKHLDKINSPEALEKRKEMLKERNKTEKQRNVISKRNKDPEFIKKCSEGRKAFFKTEKGLKEKEAIRKRMSGRKVSEETRRKLSEKMKGKTPWNKGLKGKNHKVISVSFINETMKMYDIEVEKYHNFALASGVFVHNSVGGSLIAYLMGITYVDPLKYDLLFERFLDEDRDSYPDIDLDFQDDRRAEVRMHLEDMYGKNNIAGVSTFVAMKGKYCIRDVSRVFEIPLKEVNEFCEIIEKEIEDGIQKDRSFADKYPDEVEIALKLEGNIRNAGIHPAAIIVSPSDLTKGLNSNLVKRKKAIVVNWDKDDAEYMGLMKLDVLALNTLTILSEAKSLIKENHGIDIKFEDIPLDDKDVLNSIDGINVAGLFQLNGIMAKQVTKELGVDDFNDIVAVMALGRPGPAKSGMTEEYIQRKKGKTWTKVNDTYEEILNKTMGLVVFQEDVMMIIHKVAGLPFSTADKIRKIIAKKRDVQEFKQYEEKFVEGCLKMGTLTEDKAREVWSGFLEWAEYGFPKAHAVEYGMMALWCAYIKYYYPTEFFCANLTCGKEDKKADIIQEAKAIGLEIFLPKINVSHISKWVAKDKKLFVPFLEIKGIGEATAVKMATLKRAKPKLNEAFFKKRKIDEAFKAKEKKSKLEQIADDIGAWGESCPLTAKAQEYFSFQISDRTDILYPNLCHVIDDMFPCDVEDILFGQVGYPHLINTNNQWRGQEIEKCELCNLRGRCKGAIRPLKGKYNVAIVNSYPSKDDNVKLQPLTGDSGNLLWDKLNKKGYKKSYFHVTNAIKCYPNKEIPTKSTISKCTNKWLFNELDGIDCRIILSLGSIAAKTFAGDDGKIANLNATTLWSDHYQSWVCYCVSPGSIFADPVNKRRFNFGVNNFIKTLKLFNIK